MYRDNDQWFALWPLVAREAAFGVFLDHLGWVARGSRGAEGLRALGRPVWWFCGGEPTDCFGFGPANYRTSGSGTAAWGSATGGLRAGPGTASGRSEGCSWRESPRGEPGLPGAGSPESPPRRCCVPLRRWPGTSRSGSRTTPSSDAPRSRRLSQGDAGSAARVRRRAASPRACTTTPASGGLRATAYVGNYGPARQAPGVRRLRPPAHRARRCTGRTAAGPGITPGSRRRVPGAPVPRAHDEEAIDDGALARWPSTRSATYDP